MLPNFHNDDDDDDDNNNNNNNDLIPHDHLSHPQTRPSTRPSSPADHLRDKPKPQRSTVLRRSLSILPISANHRSNGQFNLETQNLTQNPVSPSASTTRVSSPSTFKQILFRHGRSLSNSWISGRHANSDNGQAQSSAADSPRHQTKRSVDLGAYAGVVDRSSPSHGAQSPPSQLSSAASPPSQELGGVQVIGMSQPPSLASSNGVALLQHSSSSSSPSPSPSYLHYLRQGAFSPGTTSPSPISSEPQEDMISLQGRSPTDPVAMVGSESQTWRPPQGSGANANDQQHMLSHKDSFGGTQGMSRATTDHAIGDLSAFSDVNASIATVAGNPSSNLYGFGPGLDDGEAEEELRYDDTNSQLDYSLVGHAYTTTTGSDLIGNTLGRHQAPLRQADARSAITYAYASGTGSTSGSETGHGRDALTARTSSESMSESVPGAFQPAFNDAGMVRATSMGGNSISNHALESTQPQAIDGAEVGHSIPSASHSSKIVLEDGTVDEGVEADLDTNGQADVAEDAVLKKEQTLPAPEPEAKTAQRMSSSGSDQISKKTSGLPERSPAESPPKSKGARSAETRGGDPKGTTSSSSRTARSPAAPNDPSAQQDSSKEGSRNPTSSSSSRREKERSVVASSSSTQKPSGVGSKGSSAPPSQSQAQAHSSASKQRVSSRVVPQLPSAPNVKPAPPPAMYWSKAPIHGTVPRRSFRAHTANLAEEVLWLFGGCDSKGCFKDLWCFDTETMCWSKPKVSGDYPPPRRAHSATMVGRRLFVFAGGDGPNYFNDLYIFDTVSLRWFKPQVYGNPPSPRRAHTSNYYEGQLIIFGGGNGVGALNDVHTLDVTDLNRLEWKKVECKGKLPIGRGYHTSNLVDGKLIVIGGSDGHMSFNDIHILRLDTKVWYQVKTDEIHNRLGHTATQVGSYLFVFGGHDSKSYTSELLTLNLVNLQWEPRKVCGAKPQGRGYHQAWLRDSRLFIHGGFDGKDIFDDLHFLDLAACAYLPQITSFSVELDDD